MDLVFLLPFVFIPLFSFVLSFRGRKRKKIVLGPPPPPPPNVQLHSVSFSVCPKSPLEIVVAETLSEIFVSLYRFLSRCFDRIFPGFHRAQSFCGLFSNVWCVLSCNCLFCFFSIFCEFGLVVCSATPRRLAGSFPIAQGCFSRLPRAFRTLPFEDFLFRECLCRVVFLFVFFGLLLWIICILVCRLLSPTTGFLFSRV